MITIRIDNPTLSAGLFGEVVKLLDTTNGMDQLLEHGCDPQVLDTLRNLKVRDLREISARFKTWCFSFSVNDLATEVRRLGDMREDQALCEYFIRHGASRNMVAELWKMSLADVTQMRRFLLAEGGSVGRPQRPRDPEVRQQIHEAWSRIQKESAHLSRRRHIHMLHQQFLDLTIESLYSVVTEFDGEPEVHHPHRRHVPASTAPALARPGGNSKGASHYV